jgi:hypothetical protein
MWGTKEFLRSVFRFLGTANVVPSWPILATLMTQVIRPSETSVLTIATRVASQRTAFFALIQPVNNFLSVK